MFIIRFALCIAMLSAACAAALGSSPADIAAAQADYQFQKTATGDECRYADLSALPREDNPLQVVQYICVLASREPLLDDQIPELIEGTNLARLRISRLQWSAADWAIIFGAKENKYTLQANPLIVPAGYLIYKIADAKINDNAYQKLYFGSAKVPKTETEFLLALGIDQKKQRGLEQGLVEGASRVNLGRNGTRMIRHDDGTHSTSFVTYDVAALAPGKDPLEGLTDDNFKRDASEVFVLVPKIHTLGVRGVMPVTGLFNGEGAAQTEAPVNIVEDTTRFAGQAAIRNPGSCIQCHLGAQKPNLNALRDRLSAGIELLTADKARSVRIELFHLGEFDKALKDWTDGYADTVMAVNGLSLEENADSFKSCVTAWLDEVDIEQAARELTSTPEEMRAALGWAAKKKRAVGNRLVGLAYKRSVPRSGWETDFLNAQALIGEYRASLKK